MNLVIHRSPGKLNMALLGMLLLSFVASAQAPWTFRKFKKETDDKIMLPYKAKKLWLFKRDSLWGLYDQETEQQLVPPHYDMVLPGIESTFFYVIRDNFVGYYAQNGGEIMAPDQFQQLQLVIDSSGTYFLQHAEEIIKESGYYTIHSTEYRSFELVMDDQKNWSARELSQNPSISRNAHVRIKDNVKWIREDQWVHQYSYLKDADDKGSFISKINYFEVVDQQSGVVSISQKRYLIPPEYTEIKWQDGYFQARSYTLDNQINPLAYAAVESIYTSDFQLIKSPPGGYTGLIMGGGYYTHDMDGTTVTLYDSTSKQLFTIDDFEGYPNEVISIGNNFYIACCAENVEEEEMRVYKQHFYNQDGQLLHSSKFRFEEIFEDQGLSIVSVISPTGSFDLDYGIYDLEKNEFMIPPEYELLYHEETKNSLVEMPNPDCNSYFTGKHNETYFFWDCSARPFTGVVDYVSGQHYAVERLDKPLVNSPLTSEASFIIEDLMNAETFGDIGYYNAKIEDTWRGLIIYRCIHEYDDDEKVFYALGDQSQLFLAPEFKSIRFHRTHETIELECQNKNYVFPISRYTND